MTPHSRLTTGMAKHSEIRRLVKKHGGGWHGPHVEHIDMTEAAFFKMIDDPEFGALFNPKAAASFTTSSDAPWNDAKARAEKMMPGVFKP